MQQFPGFPPCTPFAHALYHGFDEHHLIFTSVNENSRKAYFKAFYHFQQQVDLNLLSLDNIDYHVAKYGQELHEEDPRKVSCSSLKYLRAFLLIAMPESHSRFYRTSRLLTTWEKEKPSVSATPVSREIMLAFVYFFLSNREKHAALCMLLCWGGLLRVSEAISLRRDALSLPGDPRPHTLRPNDVGISLDKTKTGNDQYVFIDDQIIVQRIVSLLQDTQLHENILPITNQQFNASLKRASRFFSMDSYPISSHSNRIGGALHLFMSNVPVADIAIKGRWRRPKSVELYLHNGRSWLSRITLTRETEALIRSYAEKTASLSE